jgi:exopolysaccharide production protein ExoZ
MMRGLAAFSVLIHHVLEETQPVFAGRIPHSVVLLGASGVDIFFVISGFIMYYTNHFNFGRPGASVDFLARRIIRIVPLYWLCTLAVVMLHAGGLYAHKTVTSWSVGLSLLFLPNANIVHGLGWTLNYEMYFYSILAICLLLFSSIRVGAVAVVGSIFLILALGRALPPDQTRNFLMNPITVEFCFGFALAAVFTSGYISARWCFPALVVGAAGLILGAVFGPSEGTAGLAPKIRFLFWGVPATALLVPALFAGQTKTYIGKFLLALGNASYSLYLTHGFVMTAYAKSLKASVLPNLPRALWMFAPVLVSLIVGFATWLLIEQPMSEGLKVWWKKRNFWMTLAEARTLPDSL